MSLNKLVMILTLLYASIASAENQEPLVTDVSTIMNLSCLDLYHNKYKSLKEHKAFTYSRGSEGAQACNWRYGTSSVENAVEIALKNCEKNRVKRKIDQKCSVIDIDSQIVLEKNVFPEIGNPDYTTPTDDDYIALHDKAMSLIEGTYCRKSFRSYLKKEGFKAFAFTTSAEGFYGVCGYSNKLVSTGSEEKALEICTERKYKNIYSEQMTPECKVIAKNNTLIVTREDLGLKPFTLNLMHAAERMHIETVKNLVEGGADLEQRNKKGETPLVYAIKNRRLEVVKYLVEKGADINAKSNYGRQPLGFAIYTKRNQEVVNYLKSVGAKQKN